MSSCVPAVSEAQNNSKLSLVNQHAKAFKNRLFEVQIGLSFQIAQRVRLGCLGCGRCRDMRGVGGEKGMMHFAGRKERRMHGFLDSETIAMLVASTAEDVMSVLYYYARKGFYRHMSSAAATYATKLPALHICPFFQAVGTLLEGAAVTDAIRALNALAGRRELALAVAHALLHAHSLSARSDADATAKLTKTIESEVGRAASQSFVTAGYFLLMAGDYNQARIYADKAMSSGGSAPAAAAADDDDFGFASSPTAAAPSSGGDPSTLSATAAVLRAWIDVQCGRESYVALFPQCIFVTFFPVTLAKRANGWTRPLQHPALPPALLNLVSVVLHSSSPAPNWTLPLPFSTVFVRPTLGSLPYSPSAPASSYPAPTRLLRLQHAP